MSANQTTFSNDSGVVDTISTESVVITRPGTHRVKYIVISNTSANTGWFKFDDSNSWILLPASTTITMNRITMTADLKVKPGSGDPDVYATVY